MHMYLWVNDDTVHDCNGDKIAYLVRRNSKYLYILYIIDKD